MNQGAKAAEQSAQALDTPRRQQRAVIDDVGARLERLRPGGGRQAQRVGAGQRVVQQRLHLGATQAQGCADHDGHQRPRPRERKSAV